MQDSKICDGKCKRCERSEMDDVAICDNLCGCHKVPACRPAAEEGGEWEVEFEQDQRTVGGHNCRDFIRTLLSRTRKEATDGAWREAVEAVPEKDAVKEQCSCVGPEYDNDWNPIPGTMKREPPYECGCPLDGWNEARQQLINAAKERGVNIEV